MIEGSLDNQRHRMTSFVEIKNLQEKGWGQIVESYIDDGYSAKDTNRPAYQKMLKDLRTGKINMVMVTELSRLSRNIPDFCDFLKALDVQDSKFFSVKEQFDTSTPSGKMMLYNMINLAQFEREQTSERVAINCHSRSLRGLLNGGPAILGYDKHPDKKTTFVVNKEQAADVREIFSLYLENRSLARTIDVLQTNGIKPRVRSQISNRLAKDGRWTAESLYFVLQNMAYIGKKEVNKINKGKDQSRLKSWQQYSVVPASWPAIISQETFDNVQHVLEDNKLKERNRLDGAERRVFIASQLLTCGECGGTLVGSSAHGKNKVHRYYVHTQKKGDVITCSHKRFAADVIEDAISNHLSGILQKAGYFDQIGQTIRDQVSVKPEDIKQRKTTLAAELQKVTLGIQRTFKIQAEMEADSDGIRLVAQELQELGRKKKHLSETLENLHFEETKEADVKNAIGDLKNRLEAFERGWKKATPMMRKGLLKDVLYGAIVTGRGLSIEYLLKHDLNSASGTSSGAPSTGNSNGSVTHLGDHRQKRLEAALAASGPNNLDVGKLQVMKIGSQPTISCNHIQVHDFIQLSIDELTHLAAKFRPLYAQGHSLKEISAMAGVPYSTLRNQFAKDGVTFRPNKSVSSGDIFRRHFKSSAPPPYGYCYIDGGLQKDPREYPTLQIIEKQWQRGANPTDIAKYLNKLGKPSRTGKIWKQPTVYNIVERLKSQSATPTNKGSKK